jgi:Pyrimidine dimer DNA glycosylase
MRLWTVHPQYLDAQGLVALWREGLLAQKVIAGETRGYTRHPQLTRFRQHAEPLPLIAAYLRGVADEAARRGYQFDETKIVSPESAARLVETRGQLLFEWKHLQAKLRRRRPELYRKIRKLDCPEPHPLFRIIAGNVRGWEKTATAPRQKNQRTPTTIGRM